MDIIKVWDLENSYLMSTLNEEFTFSDFKDMNVINKGAQLIARHEEGLALWNLKKSMPNFFVPETDLTYCSMVVKEGGKEMWFDAEEEVQCKIELKKGHRPLKRVQYNENMERKQLLSSGDFLEIRYSQPYGDLDSEDGSVISESSGKMKTDKDGYRYALVLVSVEKMMDAGDSFDAEEYETMNELAEYTIHESEHMITSLSVVSTLGLSRPKVFENGKVRLNPDYVGTIEKPGGNKVEVRFGNISGQCYTAVLTLDGEGGVISNKVQCVAARWQPSLAVATIGFGADKPNGNVNANEGMYVTANNEEESLETKELVEKYSEINDYTLFLNVNIEAYVFMENRQVEGKEATIIRVFARQLEGKWAECEQRLENTVNVTQTSSFTLLKMDSYARQDRYVRFAIYGALGLIIYQLDVKTNNLRVLNFNEKRIRLSVIYSESQDSFYVPSERSILVYDGSLDFLSYTIDTESEVMIIYLIEREDEKLFIYDQTHYYELDIDTLEFQKKMAIRSKEESSKSLLPFNFELFKEGEVFYIPTFNTDIEELTFITDIETLDLHMFPFSALIHCFDKEDYARPILEFSRYYFRRIAEMNQEDIYYGPLNPLLFAIYHNDMTLIERILEENLYPKAVHDYWSPLAFAFRFNYQSAVKEICDRLTNREHSVNFTRQDFTCLLGSSKSYCHKLIASIPSEPAIQNFPRLVYMKSSVRLFFVEKLDKLFNEIKKDEEQVERRASRKAGRQRKIQPVVEDVHVDPVSESSNMAGASLLTAKELEIDDIGQGNKETKQEVVVFKVPFKYDFVAGSNDSIGFLNMYCESGTEELIISQWKELVKFKWRKHRWLHVSFSFLYFVFTLFLTISLVFTPKTSKYADYISLFFIFFFMFYELLQFMSYSFFNIFK